MRSTWEFDENLPRVYIGIGHALYVGTGHDPQFHKHYAEQFVLGLDGEVEVAFESPCTAVRADAVAIPSDLSHRLKVRGRSRCC